MGEVRSDQTAGPFWWLDSSRLGLKHEHCFDWKDKGLLTRSLCVSVKKTDRGLLCVQCVNNTPRVVYSTVWIIVYECVYVNCMRRNYFCILLQISTPLRWSMACMWICLCVCVCMSVFESVFVCECGEREMDWGRGREELREKWDMGWLIWGPAGCSVYSPALTGDRNWSPQWKHEQDVHFTIKKKNCQPVTILNNNNDEDSDMSVV